MAVGSGGAGGGPGLLPRNRQPVRQSGLRCPAISPQKPRTAPMAAQPDTLTDTDPPPTPRAGRRGWSRNELAAILLIAAAAAVAGALSGCRPTGVAPADATFTGAALAVVTIAGA